MSRFFAPRENIKGDTIYIDGQEARHIINVMRLAINDKVVVFDGTGKEYVGFIKEMKPRALSVGIVETRIPKAEQLPSITLAQSLPKKDKMDYIVEKSTELGVTSILPVISERTVTRLDEAKSDERLKRWQRIAKEASKQCGRQDIPEIKPIKKYYNAVDNIDKYDLTLMACLSEETTSIKQAIRDFNTGKIIIFIGPEGDFTPDEIRMAKDNSSCKFISLGRRVLKSDTAGLYLLSILNYELST